MPKFYVESGPIRLIFDAATAEQAAVKAFQWSFYHSLRAVPLAYDEVARVYRFRWWQRFRWLELPDATMGLVWNSMMSMAGGWFLLMISAAASGAHFPLLAASVLVMSAVVVTFNRSVWRKCYRLAEERFSLNK